MGTVTHYSIHINAQLLGALPSLLEEETSRITCAFTLAKNPTHAQSQVVTRGSSRHLTSCATGKHGMAQMLQDAERSRRIEYSSF